MVGDGPFEMHTRIDKNLREVKHRLKRSHLFCVSPGVPHTYIRHRIVLAVDADIVGLVALQRTNGWDQRLLTTAPMYGPTRA